MIHYYELTFNEFSDGSCYAMYIKGYRKPTIEEAEQFVAQDMESFGVDRITDIQEVDYLEVYYGSDVSDIDSWPIFGEEEEKMSDKNFKNRLTPELVDAMDIVCGACPYISETCDNEEIVDAAYVGRYEDSGAKYCERCMVRHMYNLFAAERDAGSHLDFDSREWRAIINY